MLSIALPVSAIGETLRSGAGTPRVDGVIDEVWRTASRQKFSYVVDGDLRKGDKLPSASSAFVSSLWDEEAVYFLIEVTDDDWLVNTADVRACDTVTVMIDEADLFGPAWQDGQNAFSVIPDENGLVTVRSGRLADGFEAAVRHEGGNKRIIEIKYVPTQIKTGMDMQLLVDFRFDDRYENGDGETALAYALTWSDELNEGLLDSSNWSYLKPGAASSAGHDNAQDAAASIGGNPVDMYIFQKGSHGYGGEGPEMLWDGRVQTKFCTASFPAYSSARLGGEFHITGIIMATANDNEANRGRNPDEWKILASSDNKNWDVIAEGDESFFKEKNFTYFAQAIQPTEKTYKYVRFENKSCTSGTMQLSELLVCGVKRGKLDTLIKAEPEEPAHTGEQNLLEIVYGGNAFVSAKRSEMIAEPQLPVTEEGETPNAVGSLLVLAVLAAVLIVLCVLIVRLQEKKKQS
ncbi:MAG: discoidin domain-containing protein [Clostridia bacterium]|nr:discoidin domain-containing protein [Clostridia bacterium]